MYVVAGLPLIHQLTLQEQLHPPRLQLDADKEYALTLRKYYEGDTDAQILQKYGEATIHGHVVEDTYDVPAAMAALEQLKEPAGAHHATGRTRSSGSPLLPDALNDLWPRIFLYLTTRTRILTAEVHQAREDKLRRARVDCVTDCVIHALDGQSLGVVGQETPIARGLQGWGDLHIFMSEWIMDLCDLDNIPSPQFFSSVQRRMGLRGRLPPLLHTSNRRCEFIAAVAAAGYMVV